MAAGRDLLVVLSVRVPLQRTGLIALAEGDAFFLDVLVFVERVLDPALLVVVEDAPLARPASREVLVSGVFGAAAVGDMVERPNIALRGTHCHGCPLTCV